MNHSLVFADRTTHLKIASVALLGVFIVVAIGITARLTGAPAAAVIKAGGPAIYTHSATPRSIVDGRASERRLTATGRQILVAWSG
jgi:hypothetical protein